MARHYSRYVAIGDSSTEGLEDPNGAGGYRGWANRLAEHIAAVQGSLLYANLAVRGRRTRQVRDEQLRPALAMRPDLATLFVGTNDVVRRSFDADAVAEDVKHMQHELIESGTTVLGFTLPDLTGVMPLGRLVAPRVERLNEALRRVSESTGAILVDFAAYPVASDPRLWNEDRLHANALGHERIAAALAHALGLPGFDESWARPLPEASRPAAEWVASEIRWMSRHFVPWIWRHIRGRSSGDGRKPKRPELRAVGAASETIEVVDPRDPDARWCLTQYTSELAVRFEGGFDLERHPAPSPAELTPPRGVFLVACSNGEPVGCGALATPWPGIGLITRMWVAPSASGTGLGGRILGRLEGYAVEFGLETVRLDTNRVLLEAQALYRKHGYREVDAFNQNPYAHLWFEKRMSLKRNNPDYAGGER